MVLEGAVCIQAVLPPVLLSRGSAVCSSFAGVSMHVIISVPMLLVTKVMSCHMPADTDA